MSGCYPLHKIEKGSIFKMRDGYPVVKNDSLYIHLLIAFEHRVFNDYYDYTIKPKAVTENKSLYFKSQSFIGDSLKKEGVLVDDFFGGIYEYVDTINIEKLASKEFEIALEHYLVHHKKPEHRNKIDFDDYVIYSCLNE